jgi:hypothetical protein
VPKLAEFVPEAFLEFGAGGIIDPEKPRGPLEPAVDFDFVPQRLSDIPVGFTGKAAEIGVGVGLPLLAGGLSAASLTTQGYTKAEVAGEFAQSLSLLRVKPGRYFPEQGALTQGGIKELATPDLILSEINVRGRIVPEESVVGVSLAQEGEVGGVFNVRTPFLEVGRGGRITEGVQAETIAILGKTGKPGKVDVLTGVQEFEAGFDLLGRPSKQTIRIGEEFTSTPFTGFTESLSFPGRTTRVTSVGLEKPITEPVDIFKAGDLTVRRQDFISSTGTPGVDFQAGITVPSRRVSLGRFGFEGEGAEGVSSFRVTRGGGKKSSQDFLQGLYQESPTGNIASLASQARSTARTPLTITKTKALPSSGSIFSATTLRQRSQFEGLGTYERTEQVLLNIPGVKEKNSFNFLASYAGGLSIQQPRVRAELLLFNPRNLFKPEQAQAQISLTIPFQGQILGQATSQRQRQRELLGSDFTGRSERGFDFDFTGRPRGGFGFGFLPFFPGLDLFESRQPRVRGKRKLRRNPSLLALEYNLPRYSAGLESTALVARPFESSRRKRKKRKK